MLLYLIHRIWTLLSHLGVYVQHCSTMKLCVADFPLVKPLLGALRHFDADLAVHWLFSGIEEWPWKVAIMSLFPVIVLCWTRKLNSFLFVWLGSLGTGGDPGRDAGGVGWQALAPCTLSTHGYSVSVNSSCYVIKSQNKVLHVINVSTVIDCTTSSSVVFLEHRVLQ